MNIKKNLKPTYLLYAALGLFLFALSYAIFGLGGQYNQDLFFRVLVAVGVPIATLGHAALAYQDSNRVRLVHGTAFAAWMVISVSLSAFYVVGRSDALLNQLRNTIGDLYSLGQTLYSALFGIGIFISLTAIVIERAVRTQTSDDSKVALASLMPTLVILLAMITSAVHLWNFGTIVAQQDTFSALFATVLADAAFLAVKANIQTQLNARRNQGSYDMFDLVAWSVFGLLVAGYLVAINGASVLAKTEDLTTFRQNGLIQALITIYGMSPSLLLLGVAAMTVLTNVVDYRSGRRIDRRAVAQRILSGGDEPDNERDERSERNDRESFRS